MQFLIETNSSFRYFKQYRHNGRDVSILCVASSYSKPHGNIWPNKPDDDHISLYLFDEVFVFDKQTNDGGRCDIRGNELGRIDGIIPVSWWYILYFWIS